MSSPINRFDLPPIEYYAPRHPVDLDKLAADIVQPLDEVELPYSDVCKLRRFYRGGLWRMQ